MNKAKIMGLLKRFNQKQKNKQKEIEVRVEEFKVKVSELGRRYGMAIVPIITKYGLEVEIQILQDKDPNKVEEAIKVITGTPQEVERTIFPLEEGHSKDIAVKI